MVENQYRKELTQQYLKLAEELMSLEGRVEDNLKGLSPHTCRQSKAFNLIRLLDGDNKSYKELEDEILEDVVITRLKQATINEKMMNLATEIKSLLEDHN